MASQFELKAELRDDVGKGASRRLRKSGKVPAVIYGGSDAPRSLMVDQFELLRHAENEAFFSHVLKIKVGKIEQEAIVKDVQPHPSKRQILHIDFQRIVAGEKIRMDIPLHFVGEDVAPGVKLAGGIVSHLRTEVEISCLPKDLPEFVEVDISAMELDTMLYLSDLKLADGIEIIELSYGKDHDQPVVAVQRPRKQEEEEETSEETEVAPGEVPVAGDSDASDGDADDDKS